MVFNEWKLLLVGKWLEALLPNQETIAYREIAQSIRDLDLSNIWYFGIFDISVKSIERNKPLTSVISMLAGTGFGPLGQMHLAGTFPNGMYIDEMLIMRSASNAAAT